MNTVPQSSFATSVRKEFAFLKAANHLEGTFSRSLHLPTSGGLAVPLTQANRTSPADDAILANPDQTAFLVVSKTLQNRGRVVLQLSAPNLALAQIEGDPTGGELAEAVREIVRWSEETLWPEHCTASLSSLRTLFGDAIRDLPIRSESLSAASQPGDDPIVLSRRANWRGGEKMILTAGPSISAREASYAFDAAKYGWNDQWAKYLKAFEQSFAQYIGAKYALATSSCTGALHLALAALDIGPGDEVIVPDITWVATGNAVLYVGATPVFADVDPETWTLDPESFRSKITPRTKAVMPVHLYGHPCRMDEILKIANEHGLSVVEDAAPSIGAEVLGRRTGSFGHFAAFSFQGAKLAVTGEGGMLLTNDDELYKKVYTIWDQGRVPGTFWIAHRGWKYKLANTLAAIGLGQLERNDAMVEAKRRVFRWYEEGLAGVPHLSLNREASWARSIYWMTSILVHESSPISRDDLMKELKARKVDTRAVFPAISQYPIWPTPQTPQPNALRIGLRAINLPSGVCLAREEVAYVCAQIRDILSH
jgi:dTDP-4-amino-4,6-dideoxygalactose transaminase